MQAVRMLIIVRSGIDRPALLSISEYLLILLVTITVGTHFIHHSVQLMLHAETHALPEF